MFSLVERTAPWISSIFVGRCFGCGVRPDSETLVSNASSGLEPGLDPRLPNMVSQSEKAEKGTILGFQRRHKEYLDRLEIRISCHPSLVFFDLIFSEVISILGAVLSKDRKGAFWMGNYFATVSGGLDCDVVL